ncbi:alpha/beta hydrolase family protein [Rhodopirellula europaea]|nr:alpha/beta hydrolase [Rhodopirellula europaea]
MRSLIPAFVVSLTLTNFVSAGEVTITPDVVYGHKFGLAKTFDVFRPTENSNGAAVLFMVSGGWYSAWTPPEETKSMFRPLTEKGFTVFAVRHGSSPKFSIAEAVADVRQSVRFIRNHADQFSIDPDRIGVFGMSAGGHLSLMLGTASDEGDPEATDPVAQTSNRVQAVVAYVAPTDLQVMAKDSPDRLPVYDRFPALEIDQAIAAKDSPLRYVTLDDAPTLLLAGGKDELVPIFHSRNIQAAFEREGVTSRLIEFPEAGHGFDGEDAAKATKAMVAWFEAHLTEGSSEESK